MVEVHIPEDYWEWFRAELDMLEKELGPLAEIASRYERNAAVLCTLLRVGDYVAALDDPASVLTVTEAQAKWAIRFLTQTIRELALRFGQYVPDGETDAVLLETRRRLIAEINPATRGSYGRKYAALLAEGLVPSALLRYCMPAAKVFEGNAFAALITDQGWLERVSDEEKFAIYAGKRGRIPDVLYRVRSSLYE